jgi:hypothetical protein
LKTAISPEKATVLKPPGMTVMRGMLTGFIRMGCVSADANIVEINGPIGRMRRELRLWLLAGAPDHEHRT